MNGYSFWSLGVACYGGLALVYAGLLLWLMVDIGWKRARAHPPAWSVVFNVVGTPLLPASINAGFLLTTQPEMLALPLPSNLFITSCLYSGLLFIGFVIAQTRWWLSWSASYRGYILLKAQESSEALPIFQRLVKRYPKQGLYWGNLASAFYNLGRLPEAYVAAERALSRKGGKKALRANWWSLKAETLFALQQPVTALDAIEHALRIAPKDSRFWVRQSSYLAQLGRYQEALDAAMQAQAVIPANARGPKFHYTRWALEAQAFALNGLQRNAEALAVAEQAAALSKYAVCAELARAIALTQLGREEEARTAAEQGLAAAQRYLAIGRNIPTRAEYFTYQAHLFRLAGRADEADAAQAQSSALYTQMATPIF